MCGASLAKAEQLDPEDVRAVLGPYQTRVRSKDETTYPATRQTIDYREAPSVDAKGKAEPISVWEATGARSRFGVDVTHHARAELVGRERELSVLRETTPPPVARPASSSLALAAAAAGTRLRAAPNLIDAERRAEGEAELHKALAFYRSVGATFFIQRAEALLAKSA